MTPTVAKLVSAGLAIAAFVASALVQEPSVKEALVGIASGLVGWQFLPRAGDAPRADK